MRAPAHSTTAFKGLASGAAGADIARRSIAAPGNSECYFSAAAPLPTLRIMVDRRLMHRSSIQSVHWCLCSSHNSAASLGGYTRPFPEASATASRTIWLGLALRFMGGLRVVPPGTVFG